MLTLNHDHRHQSLCWIFAEFFVGCIVARYFNIFYCTVDKYTNYIIWDIAIISLATSYIPTMSSEYTLL